MREVISEFKSSENDRKNNFYNLFLEYLKLKEVKNV